MYNEFIILLMAHGVIRSSSS